MQTTSVVAVMYAGLLLSAIIALHPYVMRRRHADLHQTTAYLLFVAVLTIVSSAIFFVVTYLSDRFFPGLLETGLVAPFVVMIVALLPGFLAANWYVARPRLQGGSAEDMQTN